MLWSAKLSLSSILVGLVILSLGGCIGIHAVYSISRHATIDPLIASKCVEDGLSQVPHAINIQHKTSGLSLSEIATYDYQTKESKRWKHLNLRIHQNKIILRHSVFAKMDGPHEPIEQSVNNERVVMYQVEESIERTCHMNKYSFTEYCVRSHLCSRPEKFKNFGKY